MAIINKHSEPSGIILEDAYIRVESVELSRLAEYQYFIARYYKNLEAYQNKLPAFRSETYYFAYDPISSSYNPYQAAYLHLKTLEQFQNCQDSL